MVRRCRVENQRPNMTVHAHVARFYERDEELHGQKTGAVNSDLMDRAVVLMATQSAHWNKHVLKRAVRTLGPMWNYYVVETVDTTKCNREAFRGLEIKFITLKSDHGTDMNVTRSHLFKCADFWRMFREEHMLFLDVSSIVLRGVPDQLLTYDYVGLHGGTSLRRRTAMLQVLKHHDFLENPDEEDGAAFERYMRAHDKIYRLPPPELLKKHLYVGGQDTPPGNQIILVHGTDHKHDTRWKALLKDIRY